ncbi:Transposon Ty3-I Gag-Pol polyprotein [Araneus ventricosus]|uniref:Transposon Ty3-I Gag-Pol polyprotein n=1 Tax=Araneus ventricosus TaxID=182803 RepID=A0A4Y2AEM3_ARAVE|nr:Transposon Ty3-I Gag-Pol polyprotein [Araneus ventricosus]
MEFMMALADGSRITMEAYTAPMSIDIERRTVSIEMLALPEAKGNRTLLGTDFLKKSGIVLDLKNKSWYFSDKLHHKISFKEDLDVNSLQTAGSITFATIVKMKIEDLLEKDVIEECESAYGAPVVLIPKPNGKTRLCIDYRKLNEITVPDSYPLPRMDDLLQSAKHTTIMSTIDLKSGYHQINVRPADRDKPAFVCLFRTFRFKRIPTFWTPDCPCYVPEANRHVLPKPACHGISRRHHCVITHL